MAKIICSKCGKRLEGDYPICPYCKTPRVVGVQAPPPKKAKEKSKKKHPILTGVAIVFLLIVVLPALFGGSSDNAKQSSAPSEPKNSAKVEESRKGIQVDTSFDTSGYMQIDADVLFEYNAYLGGQKVVTVITVDDTDTYLIKAKTGNNEGYFYSVSCEFENKDIPDSVQEGDVLTVAGVVEEQNIFAEEIPFLDAPTAVLQNCHIVGHGEIAAAVKDGAAEQRKVCEQKKQAHEAEIAAAKKAERDEYVGKCETVNYSDVERNPDAYDGKNIKISGTVIQVSEGLLNTVTLRVDSGGNTWLVSYSREDGESRILENDKLTCYGKCTGVTSYKTVLGQTLTIPSMSMEYYD